jgi:NDP-sugar pyrophosphorylase family protein
MQGVILAAGVGSRLAPFTESRPKPLLPLLGKPLIEYTIDAFVSVGVTDLVVVVGYGAEHLKAYLGDGQKYGLRIRYAHNPRYDLGNGYSLYQARDLIDDESFIVAMADHLLSVEAIAPLLRRSGRPGFLIGADRAADDSPEGEATKLWVDGGDRVEQMGKELQRWNGIDAGVFRFNSGVFRSLERAISREKTNLTDGLMEFIGGGGNLHAVDISGSFWMDVDTLDDWHQAEKALSNAS